jgi:hypothetical protein
LYAGAMPVANFINTAFSFKPLLFFFWAMWGLFLGLWDRENQKNDHLL